MKYKDGTPYLKDIPLYVTVTNDKTKSVVPPDHMKYDHVQKALNKSRGLYEVVINVNQVWKTPSGLYVVHISPFPDDYKGADRWEVCATINYKW